MKTVEATRRPYELDGTEKVMTLGTAWRVDSANELANGDWRVVCKFDGRRLVVDLKPNQVIEVVVPVEEQE